LQINERNTCAPNGDFNFNLGSNGETGSDFADFLLGLSQNEGSFVNQTEGVAQVPAQTKGLQVYRAFYADAADRSDEAAHMKTAWRRVAVLAPHLRRRAVVTPVP